MRENQESCFWIVFAEEHNIISRYQREREMWECEWVCVVCVYVCVFGCMLCHGTYKEVTEISSLLLLCGSQGATELRLPVLVASTFTCWPTCHALQFSLLPDWVWGSHILLFCLFSPRDIFFCCTPSKVLNVLMEATPQPLASIYLKSLEC